MTPLSKLFTRLTRASVRFDAIGLRDIARECMELAYELIDEVDELTAIYADFTDKPLDADPYFSGAYLMVYREVFRKNDDNCLFHIYVSKEMYTLMDNHNIRLLD